MKKIFLFFIFLSQSAWALVPFEDAVSPELITSARALALGNAYMSKVDDAWSAFYNPAGLGTVRGLQIHLTNLHLETNNGFLNVTSNGAFTDSLSKYTDAFKPDGLRSLHAAKPGNLSHARFQTFPNITFRGITLGYMYSQQNRARLQSLNDSFEISERVDSGPVMALSASLFGGIVKFGATVIYLTRKELQKDFLSTDPITVDSSVDYKKGTMTHITSGFRLTMPFAGLPTFSAVLRNSSATEFDSEELGGLPDEIPQTVDYALSITPNLGRTIRLHWEIAQKDVGDRYDTVPAQRKLMTGIEFDYMRKMFVRFGYGDGWGSSGIGVRNKDFSFDLTSYAIEASADGVREDEDRRYILSISAGI
ncbi:MAG: hypothetical protein HON90_04810 [Halobacteriovoraceae bacterium]|jgi:hypothetical protein|nr:hypothetical protein [Halobacteriovoraceae bacterium]